MIPSYVVYYALQKIKSRGLSSIDELNVDDNQNIILSRDKHRKIFYSNR